MGNLQFRGVRIFYQTWGGDRPLLLLHSGGSSDAQWQTVAEHFPTGHLLIAPDLLGFGKSQSWPNPGGLTHDLQADLVAATIVCGDRTNGPDGRVTELLHSAIGQSRHMVIDGAGHMPPFNHAPAAIVCQHHARIGQP